MTFQTIRQFEELKDLNFFEHYNNYYWGYPGPTETYSGSNAVSSLHSDVMPERCKA
jgi:hypothetical protein